MKSIQYYSTRSGKEPYFDWFNRIKDFRATAHINTRVKRLILGHHGDCKRVGKGVFELRIHHGPGYRVYFAELKSQIVVLLLGGDKKSQKHDIQLAIEYWKQYKDQYHEKKQYEKST